MAKTIAPLLPPTTELLHRFGDRLRLARLRRQLTAKQVAERAGMAPMTLRSLERGGAGVTMGAYLAVMQVLGIEKDLDLLAATDPLGRELQDARLPAYRKASGRAKPLASSGSMQHKLHKLGLASLQQDIQALPDKQELKSSEDRGRWVESSGYTSSRALADLLDPKISPAKKRR